MKKNEENVFDYLSMEESENLPQVPGQVRDHVKANISLISNFARITEHFIEQTGSVLLTIAGKKNEQPMIKRNNRGPSEPK